ncbi:MAG: cell division protein FtsB [Steroidobacteraceae bacterium]|nr:cell division protein FtsB [Betaproteobacteria bacterium]
MKTFAGLLLTLTVLLQYRLWLSDDGVGEVMRLRSAIVQQQATNGELQRRNAQMAAEVADLKSGMTAIEERARSELGMVANSETFYQVVPRMTPAPGASGAQPAGARTRTAQR